MGRKKKRTGRPSKLSPEVQEEICASVRAGNYIEPSAMRAGVDKTTLYNWLKKAGKELERVARGQAKGRNVRVTARMEPYVEFLYAVKKAEALAEARDVAIISKAAAKQWQAAAWRLERKHYDRWGRRQLIENKTDDKKPKKVQRVKIGDKEIEF
jgi:transposase